MATGNDTPIQQWEARRPSGVRYTEEKVSTRPVAMPQPSDTASEISSWAMIFHLERTPQTGGQGWTRRKTLHRVRDGGRKRGGLHRELHNEMYTRSKGATLCVSRPIEAALA
ncbi:hypothetical protein V7S43_004986 [Phytophthora oleae]|uniref:Uncharacterized protein n=1 Tax=Phytophthora oleae TaxID=2107226 RepID=A0ABD3FTK1_9STRA